jgi:hypothetical protein
MLEGEGVTEVLSTCRTCGNVLPFSEMSHDKYYKSGHRGICKRCYANYASLRLHTSGKVLPYNVTKEGSSYLGIHIAERLLSKVFNNVERMPMCNRGYDFICGKGKRIDSKCSTEKHEHGHCTRWRFDIEKNTTADYFACIAFDNRVDINPLYFWLIPGHKINHLRCFTISISTIDKWDIYRQPIDRMLKCCTSMREVVAT